MGYKTFESVAYLLSHELTSIKLIHYKYLLLNKLMQETFIYL